VSQYIQLSHAPPWFSSCAFLDRTGQDSINYTITELTSATQISTDTTVIDPSFLWPHGICPTRTELDQLQHLNFVLSYSNFCLYGVYWPISSDNKPVLLLSILRQIGTDWFCTFIHWLPALIRIIHSISHSLFAIYVMDDPPHHNKCGIFYRWYAI
jgi:hypothetical protein